MPIYIDFLLLFMFGHSEGEFRCVGPADVGSGFKFFLNMSLKHINEPTRPY